jgi:hypothetical protein
METGRWGSNAKDKLPTNRSYYSIDVDVDGDIVVDALLQTDASFAPHFLSSSDPQRQHIVLFIPSPPRPVEEREATLTCNI